MHSGDEGHHSEESTCTMSSLPPASTGGEYAVETDAPRNLMSGKERVQSLLALFSSGLILNFIFIFYMMKFVKSL